MHKQFTNYLCSILFNFNPLILLFKIDLHIFTGAERVLHLRLEMPEELPPLIIEMLDRAENVCIP